MQGLTLLATIVATGLFAAMAAFQATLAAGAPLAAHVLGGRHSGVLPPRLRAFSGIAAVLLLVFALVILARAEIVGRPLGNLASRSRFERTALATTAVLSVLCGFVALTA